MQIIVLTYNRPYSLKRLIESVNTSLGEQEVTLRISLEYGADKKTREYVSELPWKRGEKVIEENEEKLGVDQHFLKCIRKAEEADYTLILEDDLFVIPGFYRFLMYTQKMVEMGTDIAGGGLYHYENMEGTLFPFLPLNNGARAYLLQKVSSRGFFINRKNAVDFNQWLDQSDYNEKMSTPSYNERWGESVWETHFNRYLIQTNRYFLYPRTSYLTAFGEPGLHFTKKEQRYKAQSSLYYAGDVDYPIQEDQELIRYDAWYEIEPEFLKRNNPKLKDYDFDCDLHGFKRDEDLKTKLVLTSRPVSRNKGILAYTLELKPPENNVLYDLSGRDLILVRKKHRINGNWFERLKRQYRLQLYYNYKHSFVMGFRNVLAKYLSRL